MTEKIPEKIPVVVLTTSISLNDRQQAYLNYASSYVAKPINFERFEELIRNLGRYWTLCNIPPENGRDFG